MKRCRLEAEEGFQPLKKVERANGDSKNSTVRFPFPVEVLEILFTHLSITDLCNCQLVCRQWNQIITRCGFLIFRKLYYRMKIKNEDEELKQWMSEGCLYSSSFFIQNLTKVINRLLSSQFIHEDVKELEALSLLKCHSLYPIIDKSPSLQSLLLQYHHKGSQLVSVVTCLIVLCKDVFETKQIFQNLLACFGTAKATEVFYCFATIFYYLWRKSIIPQRLHFQTFYILKNFEKSKNLTGVVTLTQEQMKIVQHSISPGDRVKIIAFAGTGKTTCLIHLANSNPRLRFLYLCFNKSVSEYAGTVFGKNVKAMTFHSLAYGSVGKHYSRSKLLFGSLKEGDIKSVVGGADGLVVFRKDIVLTIEEFMASPDQEITHSHLPGKIALEAEDVLQYLDEVVANAKSVWSVMIDQNDFRVKLPHDGYLKLYQMYKCTITGYDCIMVDEAQDITPAIISILQLQDCPEIVVGDPHQQIYSFRGATNGLGSIQATHTYYLTESFRFGPNIAFIASCILDTLKGVHLQTLTGGYQQGGFSGVEEGQIAIIARTNIGLFKEMATLIENNPNCNIAVTGSVESYGFDMLLDIYRYYANIDLDEIQNGLVKKFLSTKSQFHKFKKYAEDIEDTSLMNKIKICEQYSHRLPYLIGVLKQKLQANSKNLSTADIVFTTTHKSKGLEFDTVIMTDDYMESMELQLQLLNPRNEALAMERVLDKIAVDEKNLVYVAVTRAKKQVFLSQNVVKILAYGREHFVHPSVVKCCDKADCNCSLACCSCSCQLTNNSCSFEKQKIVLGTRHSLPVIGCLCGNCSFKYVPHLVSLLLL